MEYRSVSLILSAILHVALIALILFGLPFSTPPVEPETVVMMVDFADAKIAEKTNAPPPAPSPTPRPRPEPKPDPKPEPPKVEAPPPPAPPQPKAEPQPQTPPPPAPPPPVKVAEPPPPPLPEPTELAPPPPPKPEPPPPEPPPPQPVAKPEPPKPEPPKPEAPKAVVEAPAPPAPKPPAPKPAPPAPKLDTNALAQLLDKRIKDKDKSSPAAPDAPPKPPQPNSATASNFNAGEPMTISEIDAIRQQIARCWNFDPGVKDPGSLIVKLRIYLNQDGSLNQRPVVLATRNDSYGQKAADSAVRAVLQCSPLKNLPPAKFERWREIEITFNPKDMLG